MNVSSRLRFTLFLCLGLLPASSSLAAERVVRPIRAPGFVEWQPTGPFASLVLMVSGPDHYFLQRTFGAGEDPILSVSGPNGVLADGLYAWEVSAVPAVTPQQRRMMDEIRAGSPETAGLADPELGVDGRTIGWFTIREGTVVVEEREPAPAETRIAAAVDQPIRTSEEVVLTNGDGVIRNSLCVGLDCPDSPVFDDSTLLLMENNTRIKFGDTSASTFPANDWEIEANSSVSGGGNYLGFNDCGTADNDGGCASDLVFAVEAGARASALFVESDGDIGIGTSQPVLDLHLVTGNTPGIRLDQDASSGFTPQVWDVAGNEASFFVRDATNGSRLPLRIRPGAPSSAIDVATSGNVGIGTSSPTAPLHVRRTDATAKLIVEEASATASFRTLIQLTNNGGTGLLFTNTSIPSSSWQNALFGTNAANERLVITKGGTGIEEFVFRPNGNLEISGNYVSKGTTLNVPDFVFEPDFELMPLADLASFVRERKHLPDVPSAREIEAGTLNLTTMQMTLLQKIEELTLYTLEQQEQLQELTERNERLEQRVAALAERVRD